MPKRYLRCVLAAVLAIALTPALSFADDRQEQAYFFGSTVDAGLDTGYTESNEIVREDPHFGWQLGSFTISGYTSVKENAQGIPVFLKTTDDKIKLSFKLDQDIDSLNGDESLTISGDSNGYDQHFGVPATDFGRGALIIRQTNYRNETGEAQVYTDYLSGIVTGADTEVVLLEEGNYEVSLDYEIKRSNGLGPVPLPAGYSNYKIAFKFEVRNGNCMVFPMDLATKSELTNDSYAPNGFYLDLAKSRYLDINIKREVMAAGANGLVEDTRFNGPARDGDEYVDEGIYTITATNPSTGQDTVKRIYVGSDPVLKAYAVTGLPIETINQRLANGDVINENGLLVTPASTDSETDQADEGVFGLLIALLFAAAIFVIAIGIALNRRRKGSVPEASLKSLEAGDEAKLLDSGKEE